MRIVLACDLGGSSFRSALVDDTGATHASYSVSMPIDVSASGMSEADPEIWWSALTANVAMLAAAHPEAFGRVEAIAISAMTRSQVFIDGHHKVIRPSILWGDTRAGGIATSIRSQCPAGHPETASLNAFHPVSRLVWLKGSEPAQFRSVAYCLDPKDYLHLRLTGVAASDPVSMARLVAAAERGPACASIFDALGLSPSLIPALREPVSVMGKLRAGLDGALDRLCGIPVIMMANDTWASVVGLGAMCAGLGYNLSGTSEVLGIMSTTGAQADGLLTIDWSGGLTQTGGPSQNGGDTVIWMLDLLGHATGDMNLTAAGLARLLSGSRSSDPLLFLPYLKGERVPYWNPSLRGAWVGLNRHHTASDLAWSVLEGVAFLNRVVLERAEQAAGSQVAEIRFGGGGAANPVWCQIKADVLDRPIVVTGEVQHGLFGAAIAAWVALGRFPDLATAQAALVRVAKRYEPSAGRRSHYDQLYEIFRETERVLAPVSAHLAGFTGRSLVTGDAA